VKGQEIETVGIGAIEQARGQGNHLRLFAQPHILADFVELDHTQFGAIGPTNPLPRLQGQAGIIGAHHRKGIGIVTSSPLATAFSSSKRRVFASWTDSCMGQP
jgi:hypothetical protein